jgi:5'-deoxynucleotidase YfbR-like HD superfamily hydrolase
VLSKDIRTLAWVPRWSIVRTLRQQNVAEHSYFVAIYADRIADILEWDGDRYELLLYALQHDIEESFTGDIPHPIKAMGIDRNKFDKFIDHQNNERFGRWLITPSNDVKSIVAVADMLEGLMFLTNEASMGNSEVIRVAGMLREQLRLLVEQCPCPAKHNQLSIQLDLYESDEINSKTGFLDADNEELVNFRISGVQNG